MERKKNRRQTEYKKFGYGNCLKIDSLSDFTLEYHPHKNVYG